MARTAGRSRFSKDVMEAHLRNRREILEEEMLRRFKFTMDRTHRKALPQDAPQALALLVGQWLTTQDLIDDFIDDIIRSRPSAYPPQQQSPVANG